MSGTLGKIFKVGLIIAAVVVNVVPGVGQAISAGLTSVGLAASAGTVALGAIGLGLGAASSLLAKKPHVSATQSDRLHATLNTASPRTIIFGDTALAADVRYDEWWGGDQEYYSQVMVVASHWCEAIEQIWLNNELAWTVSGGTQGKYAGYFFVGQNAQATPTSVYHNDWSNRWGANAVFTGCATLYVQYKVTGNSKKATSPFSTSTPNRITIRGKAARLYDPRLDGSRGGSGAMRADDQLTWAWASQGVEIGRNPALQLLFYLLGWRIQNPQTGAWKLAVGCGIPPERIDLDSFVTAANLCDEMVFKSDGSQEPRYRSDGAFSTADSPAQVFSAFEAVMNGKLRDWGGRIALQIFHDDLATPVVDFVEGDVLHAVDFDAGQAIPINLIRGKFTDPSDSSLYQQADYPAVGLPSLDGIDRIDTVDFALAQSPDQAQRLAKMRLERAQYPSVFTGNFNAKAWGVKDGDPVRLTFPRAGFDRKLFRVELTTVAVNGICPMRLIEENSAIYAAFSDTRALVAPAVPTTFDPVLLPIPQAIADAARTADWSEIVNDNEKKPDDNAVNTRLPTAPIGPTKTVADLLISIAAVDALPDAFSLIDQKIDPAIGRIGALEMVGLTSAAVDRQRDADLDQLGRTVAGLLIAANDAKMAMRDAGISVDPATGVVRLYALEETRERVGDVEVRLSAQDAAITLRATRTELYDAIAVASIDPAQRNDLEQLIARIAQAEVDIVGADAQITLKASATDLTALDQRYNLRVGAVEQSLAAVGDTVGLTNTIRQARYEVDASGLNALDALVQGDIAKRAQIRALAEATEQLTTSITQGNAAEAKQRLALAVQVASQMAALVSQQRVTADAVSAAAELLDQLEAAVSAPGVGIDARIDAVTRAQASLQGAQSSFNEAIEARVDNVGGSGHTIEAAIAQSRDAEADLAAGKASTQVTDALASRINNAGGTGQSIEAAITQDRQTLAALGTGKASASDLTAVKARIDDTAGHGTLEAVVAALYAADADAAGKLAARLELVAQVPGAIAGIRALATLADGTATSDLALIGAAIGLWLDKGDGTLFQAMGLELVDGEPLIRFYGRIIAANLETNAVMVPAYAATPQAVNGSGIGSVATILSTTVALKRDGIVKVTLNAQHTYASGARPYRYLIYIDDTLVRDTGVKGAVLDLPSLSARRGCAAGPRAIRVDFAGDPGLSLDMAEIDVQGFNATEG